MYSSASIANYLSSIITGPAKPTNDSPKQQQQKMESTPIPKSFIISTPEEKIISINMKSVKLKPEEKASANVNGGKVEEDADVEDEDFISINKRQLTYAEVASIAVKLAKK